MLRRTPLLLVAVFLLLGLAQLVITPSPVAAQAVAQAYETDTPLERGIIVRISATDKTKVEALNEQASGYMEGVVVAANDAPVTLSSANATEQQVFVADTGQYNVLVSNQNGVIHTNDYVTISSLAGVGMKAGGTEPIVVGRALANFDGTTNVSATTSLKESTGQTKTVAIGLIPVNINITHNPLLKQKASPVPGLTFLQSGAQAIVNKSVGTTRLYLSILLLVVVAIVSGSILYSGVRNGMTAIGRNPLAKTSVLRGLMQAVLVGITIFIIGLIGVYLLLKL